MENKESYSQYLQEQLNEWVKELNQLKEKAEHYGAKAYKNLPEQIKFLETKIDEGTVKIKEIAEMNEESWEALKNGIDSAWESLSAGFKEATAKFKWDREQ